MEVDRVDASGAARARADVLIRYEYDATGVVTWETKRFYDYARPIAAIRFLFNGRTIQGFDSGGPAAGLVQIAGEAWRAFQKDSFPTPPFPEYTSGHSAFSAA